MYAVYVSGISFTSRASVVWVLFHTLEATALLVHPVLASVIFNTVAAYQGSNLSSHTRKMRVKKAISEVVFSLLAFSRE